MCKVLNKPSVKCTSVFIANPSSYRTLKVVLRFIESRKVKRSPFCLRSEVAAQRGAGKKSIRSTFDFANEIAQQNPTSAI